MGVEVHVPTRITVDPAALTKDDGAVVHNAFVDATQRALRTGADTVGERHGEPAQVVVNAPGVTWTGPGLAAVSADTRSKVEARLVSATADQAALLERGKGAPTTRRGERSSSWRVIGTLELKARVGALAAVLDRLGGPAATVSALYPDRLEEVRSATVRVVEVVRPAMLDDLVAGVAAALPRRGSGRLFWGYSIHPADRLVLTGLDESGGLARDLPDLAVNRRTVVGLPEGVGLGPGAQVLFLSFAMPLVEAAGRLVLAPEETVEVALRELDFLIEPQSFEAAFGVGWPAYAAAFGDRRSVLRLQVFTAGGPVHYDTLAELFREEVRKSRVEPGSWFFGELMLLTADRMGGLPEVARRQLEPYATRETRELGPDRERGTWQAGWAGAYVYAMLVPEWTETSFARQRALARKRAETLISLLRADRGELLWPYNILTFLRRNYSRADATSFEYLLGELEEREDGRWFRALFDWIEAEENGDLHWYVLDLASRSAYRDHQRVGDSVYLFNKRRRRYLPHLYWETGKEIWLDRSWRRKLKRYQLIYDVDHDYRAVKEEKLLKPAREKELVEQMKKTAPAFIEKILTGEEKRVFEDENALMMAIVEQAATEIHLKEKDLYTRTTERTLRLIDVQRRVDPFEHYLITYDIWESVHNEDDPKPWPWKLVKESERTDTDIDFQWLIWGWEYQHEAARMEAFAIGVVTVSMLPIVVIGAPVLVWLAGGWQTVVFSIALSEAFYAWRIWKGEDFSAEGVAMAAVDGYIGALGFRAGGFPASMLAKKIGTETTRAVVVGWLAEKTTKAMIGGAGSAAAMTFTHDLVNAALRGGRLSSPEEYIDAMRMGLILGFAFEAAPTVLRPLARSLGSEAATLAALETAEEVAGVLRRGRVSPAVWRQIIAEALEAMGPKLKAAFTDETAKRLLAAMGKRLGNVGDALASPLETTAAAAAEVAVQARRQFLERVIQVSGVELRGSAAQGLNRYARLTAESVDREAALAFVNGLRKSGRLNKFLEGMAALDDETAAGLVGRGQVEALASSKHVLDLIAARRAYETLAVIEDFFGGSVADADAFFERLGSRAGGQRLRATEILLRPGQVIPPESMLLALSKGAQLTDETVLALDRLYGSPLGSDRVDAILRATHPSNLPAVLRVVAGAAPAELEALVRGELLSALSRSPAVLRFAQTPGGLGRLIKLMTPRGRLGADPTVAVDALERMVRRRPGMSMEQLGTVVDNLTFPLVEVTPEQIDRIVDQAFEDIEAGLADRPVVKGGYIEQPALIEGGAPEEVRVREGYVVPKGQTVTKGGRIYKEGEVVPPGTTKLDIQDIPLTPEELKIPIPEERLPAALRRVRRVIGRRLSDTPLGKVWNEIREEKLAGRTPQQVGREGMLKLYNDIRDEFWNRIRNSPEHVEYLRRAGYYIDETGAAYLGTNNPALGVGQTKVSLDHQFEKSYQQNWVMAIDADNLVFEFANPNSYVDSIQRAFGIGTYAPSVSPIGASRGVPIPVAPPP
jgi:hypothetical protein